MKVGGGPDAVDELWNINPYSSTFDDENNLGENDDRDDDSCPIGNRLCEGMSSPGSQRDGDPRYQTKLWVSAMYVVSVGGPCEGAVELAFPSDESRSA